MKRIIMGAGLLLMLTIGAEAQTKGKTGVKKQQAFRSKNVTNKTVVQKNLTNNYNKPEGGTTVLNSTGTYKAYGGTNREAAQLQISDPVVRTLNERAAAPADASVPGSGIMGMPKLTYGIAHGHLLFRSTDAPTLGTSTGSGSVGTGTNVGPVGTAGNALGVNGKNPYAGPGIYGLPIRDDNFTQTLIDKANTQNIQPPAAKRKKQ